MSTEQLDGGPFSETGGILKMGDVITFSGVYVDPWWKRVLRWLRIMPKRAKPDLQQFVVTWIDENDPL